MFLRGFRPDWIEASASGDDEETRTIACLPVPRPPSFRILVALAVVYVLFVATVLLKAYAHRVRVQLAGFFYPERRADRLVHLYAVLLRRRRRLPYLLRQLALNGRRRRLAGEVSSSSSAAAAAVGGRCAAFLRRRRAAGRCVVCSSREPVGKLRECACGGLYCVDCFADVGRACPLCRHDDDAVGCSSSNLESSSSDDDDGQFYRRRRRHNNGCGGEEDDDGGALEDGLEAYGLACRVEL
jgi:hypothetical protein